MFGLRRLRPELLGSSLVVAVVLATTVGGSAVADRLLTGKNIRNESLTGDDIRNGSLTRADLADSVATSVPGPAGPRGSIGPQGVAGPVGRTGAPGAIGGPAPIAALTSTAPDTTTSTDFVDVVGMATTFTTPAGSSRLLATFSSECSVTHPSASRHLSVRVLIDGIEAAPAAGGNFAYCTSDADNPSVDRRSSNSMQRIARVTPGAHRVVVQSSVSGIGATGRLDDEILVLTAG